MSKSPTTTKSGKEVAPPNPPRQDLLEDIADEEISINGLAQASPGAGEPHQPDVKMRKRGISGGHRRSPRPLLGDLGAVLG